MSASRTQRWRDRRATYRPGAEEFRPDAYGVELVDEATAREFVCRNHYSGSYPAARLRVGLYRARRGISPELVGVAVFSVPAGPSVISRWCGPSAGVELGRFVLLDDVPGNGETWFLRRAFALTGSLEVAAVLAFADPTPRRTLAGAVVKPGHVGTIYQSHNGRYLGRTTARTLYLAPDGTVFSGRAISKLRSEDRGWRYAIDQLQAAGAPRWLAGESGASYWVRVLAGGHLRRARHPGNHAYLWPLGDRRERRAVLAGAPPALPAPSLLEAQ